VPASPHCVCLLFELATLFIFEPLIQNSFSHSPQPFVHVSSRKRRSCCGQLGGLGTSLPSTPFGSLFMNAAFGHYGLFDYKQLLEGNVYVVYVVAGWANVARSCFLRLPCFCFAILGLVLPRLSSERVAPG
jgi:hypothetical protein